MAGGRIDTHTHVVPPAYRRWLDEQAWYPGPYIDWSVDAALEAFGRLGVATGILSISTPGVRVDPAGDPETFRSLARALNEFCADVVREDDAHFGFFGTLTLPDVDGAIAEAEYALDQLHADGVVLLTNANGTYLGAPEFDPLFEFLDQRQAVVFVHPTNPPVTPIAGINPGVIDFLYDSVRCAVNLTKHEVLSRFAGMKVVLSHAGGFLPFAAVRIAMMSLPDREVDAAVDEYRRFYFDVAGSSTPYALPSLLAFADPSHITFGSDWPYATDAQAGELAGMLDAYPLTEEQAGAIDRGNAEQLFPRLSGLG